MKRVSSKRPKWPRITIVYRRNRQEPGSSFRHGNPGSQIHNTTLIDVFKDIFIYSNIYIDLDINIYIIFSY